MKFKPKQTPPFAHCQATHQSIEGNRIRPARFSFVLVLRVGGSGFWAWATNGSPAISGVCMCGPARHCSGDQYSSPTASTDATVMYTLFSLFLSGLSLSPSSRGSTLPQRESAGEQRQASTGSSTGSRSSLPFSVSLSLSLSLFFSFPRTQSSVSCKGACHCWTHSHDMPPIGHAFSAQLSELRLDLKSHVQDSDTMKPLPCILYFLYAM